MDCVLADQWDDWGPCSVRCGTGIKRRVRRVLQEPLNGGRPCPGNTVEKAVCEGTSCKVARASNGFDELRGQSVGPIDHFSGPGTAVDPPCVCVSALISFELNDLLPIYL